MKGVTFKLSTCFRVIPSVE